MGAESSQIIDDKFEIDRIGNILMAAGLLIFIILINLIYMKLLKSEKEDHISIYTLLSHLNAN